MIRRKPDFPPDDAAKYHGYAFAFLAGVFPDCRRRWAFLLVCHERFKREARACFPDDVAFSCPSVEATSDQLHVFLSTADESEEDIIVVTGPAVILPFAADEEQFDSAPIVSPVTSVSKQALMAALDEKFIFTAFLKDHGVPYTDRDGVYGVASLSELPELAAGAQPCKSLSPGPAGR